MLLSRKVLQRILGALWLIDGLLQLQPLMFTGNMINSIMKPMLQGQPGFAEPSLQFIVAQTTLHLTEANLLIAIVQICLGLGFLLLADRWVKQLVIASVVWALIVWYGGEGMSMLLTGKGSVLTGAPGAVLLYPLIGLIVYPGQKSASTSKSSTVKAGESGMLSRVQLSRILSGFWFFAALLQLQPYWWQPGHISQNIRALLGQGGLDGALVDPVLHRLSNITTTIEIPLNIALIVVFLGLGIALALVKQEQLRPVLIASIVASLVLWYFAEAFGMLLTGMATDFNSGLLLVVMALACWPKMHALRAARHRFARDLKEMERSTQPV
ncbi:MAG: hypothetical protein NVS3B14_16160 [Ktedonobacteraceae bacterium]